MQVNDSAPPQPPSPTGREEVRAVGEDGSAGGRSGAGRDFRRALERKRRAPAGEGDALDQASAAAMAGWFRSEGAAATPTTRAANVAAVAAARVVDRVLIGSGPGGAQARIRIAAGVLAGTEIQLASTSGHTVEARLLTHAASSRETLSVAMEAIRSRLRDKGIILAAKAPGTRAGGTAGTVSDPPGRPTGDRAGSGR